MKRPMIVETFRGNCPDCGCEIAVRGIDGRTYDIEACPGCGKPWRINIGHVVGWGGTWSGIGWGKQRGQARPIAYIQAEEGTA